MVATFHEITNMPSHQDQLHQWNSSTPDVPPLACGGGFRMSISSSRKGEREGDREMK